MAKAKVVVPNKEYTQEQKTLKYCSIELYPDSKSYNFDKVYSNLKEYCNLHHTSYVSMFHDSDYYSENTFNSYKELIGVKGEKKKSHYHVLLSFANRVGLNDIALAFGIEDRWIKILKHDYDFDNMIVYLTHIKYDESVKHHYSPSLFDSNILDYCKFIYDHALKQLESESNNPVQYTMYVLKGLSHKTRVTDIVSVLLDTFDLNVINKYYRIIRDLVFEHNQNVDVEEKEEILTEKIKGAQVKEKLEDDIRIRNLVDSFGCTDIEIGGETFTISRKRELSESRRKELFGNETVCRK